MEDNFNPDLRDLISPLPLGRSLFSAGMTAIAFLLTGLALLPLLAILAKILIEGVPHLSWEVFTSLPAPVGSQGEPNGFANAILGTLIMVGIGAVLSIPIGVLTAIYLAEFGKGKPIASILRFMVTILSGVPSIVVGVFAYGVIVLTFKGFSALAGGFALAIVMLPVVTLATEEALKLVPTPQRLASAALGANPLQTTFRIVVATALPGITTGVLLAVARAAGETAPLIFTALFTQNWPEGLLKPAPSLSVLIYNYANSAFVEQNQMAWSASAILVGMVLLFNILSRLVINRRLEK
ncbi:phosphate ABC transporter permease PstA [Kovacikia minuta CCNUW1]|uniref:phosphate ABC transporter permease PstA n=1 Tax=Kovacikia minuta TaxID=2931930 RepID=UPI001CCCC030|nr:phosphate ABC transporter permease PstA [Kovacikia minuta]UBF27273.1 phosphate ABC transporter permease PstA [Kovacikia minuta CCNUW1]